MVPFAVKKCLLASWLPVLLLPELSWHFVRKLLCLLFDSQLRDVRGQSHPFPVRLVRIDAGADRLSRAGRVGTTSEALIFRRGNASTCTCKVRFSPTHLAGFQEVKANVGVTGHGVQAVLAEVLVDVFWCRLGQEAVYTLPKRKRSSKKKKKHNCLRKNCKLLTLLSNGHIPFCSNRSTYPVTTSRGGNDV